MKHASETDGRGLPSWFRDELARTPDPGPEELARYSYMKDGFLAAMREKYKEATAPGPVGALIDVVFDLSGRLLRWAQGTDAISLQAKPVFAATRSGYRGGGAGKPGGDLARARKQVGSLLVELRTLLDQGKLWLAVAVTSTDRGGYLPFQVSIYDEAGALVAGPDDWGKGQPARYPGPEKGSYRIEIEAAGQSCTMSASFE